MPLRTDDDTRGPAAAWLALGLLLVGLGTAFLGPALPVLAHDWQINDQQSGLLIAAKFIGAFLGGLSVHRLLRYGILAGHLLAAAGYFTFAMSHGMGVGVVGLFVSGYGVGLGITSMNVLIGRRYTTHTGSALSTLNFFFATGAVACGFLAALLLPRFGLHGPILAFAGLFLITALGGLAMSSHANVSADVVVDGERPISSRLHLYFAGLLFLYGGLETCLTAWLTTYSLRLGGVHLSGAQSAVVLLWLALTAGRALSSAAMRFFAESAVQRVGLVVSAVMILAIATTHRNELLSVYCVLLGLSLAPFFPSTFAILMRRRPTSRQAGTVIAASGLGAALFPWMMGAVSTHSGSLRVAMIVPLLLSLGLLAMSRVPKTAQG
jgi:FHS family glucose/mannose:H+ symporter-like MFS transporter